jgi:hypothetical protein
MKLLSVMGAVATAAITEAKSFNTFPMATRYLQDESGNSYAYLDDVSGYSIQYHSCVRVKLPTDNEDDQAEGNVYFYNGRYHAQFQRYATFHLCRNDGMQCSCDESVEYTTEMNQFLKKTLQYFDNYCTEGDCGNYYNGDYEDESQFLACSMGHQDEDGNQYYYAPQCDDSSSGIVIGVFYDDECTIKTKNSAPDFKYFKFQYVQNTCVDCAEAGYCDEIYQDSYHCINGKEASGKQGSDLDVCGTVKKLLYNHEYNSVRTRHSGEKVFLIVFFSLVALSAIGGFIFLSYTYYIRHRNGGDALLNSDQLSGEAAPGTLT